MKALVSKTFLGLALAMPAGAAWGLAVSEVELQSRLNQPLDARIRLAASQAELDGLVVSVSGSASGGTAHVALKHEIAQDDGGLYIHITSADAIREPILMLQLQLNWSQGRLSREYPLIVDPD